MINVNQLSYDQCKEFDCIDQLLDKKVTDPQNAVNVDTLTDDMLPSQSQVFDKYIQTILTQMKVQIQIHDSND